MPITTDYDTFAARYHDATESNISNLHASQAWARLQAENEYLKTSLQTTTSYHTDKYELLKAEHEKLKADADDGDLVYSEEDLTELKEGWGEVLQDEIDELKEELDRTAYIAAAPEMRYTGDEMEEMVKIKEDIEEHPDYKETIDDLLSDYEDDIKKLKEENEKLKEFRKNQGIDQELLGSLEAENYTLKAENKDITEQLEEMYSKHPPMTEEEFLERHGITAEEKKMLLAQCS